MPLPTSNIAPAARFLGIDDVLAVTSLSATQQRRLQKAKEFPQPVRISKRRVAWIAAEVEEWCEARIAAHRGANWPGRSAA